MSYPTTLRSRFRRRRYFASKASWLDDWSRASMKRSAFTAREKMNGVTRIRRTPRFIRRSGPICCATDAAGKPPICAIRPLRLATACLSSGRALDTGPRASALALRNSILRITLASVCAARTLAGSSTVEYHSRSLPRVRSTSKMRRRTLCSAERSRSPDRFAQRGPRVAARASSTRGTRPAIAGARRSGGRTIRDAGGTPAVRRASFAGSTRSAIHSHLQEVLVLPGMLPIEDHCHFAGAELTPGKAVEIHPVIVRRARRAGVTNAQAPRQQPERELGIFERRTPEARVETNARYRRRRRETVASARYCSCRRTGGPAQAAFGMSEYANCSIASPHT